MVSDKYTNNSSDYLKLFEYRLAILEEAKRNIGINVFWKEIVSVFPSINDYIKKRIR